MTSRLQAFVKLSAALTGFSPVILYGTGMAQTYLRKIESVVPELILDDLSDAFSSAEALSSPPDLEAMLDDADLGPVARTVILLWYCGTWTRLPDGWRARNGAAADDTTQVISGAAYQAGLQWTAAGAHPAGARQQGFGAWAVAPAGLFG
jgi:hypothetical protein